MKEQNKIPAYNRVKTSLALEKITAVENLTVEDSDIDAEYARMAEQYGETIEVIKDRYKDERSANYIKDSVVQKKLMDMLMDSAVKVPESEVTEEAE